MSSDEIIKISNVVLDELDKEIPSVYVLHKCLRSLFHEQTAFIKMYENDNTGNRSDIMRQTNLVNHIIESIFIHLCDEKHDK